MQTILSNVPQLRSIDATAAYTKTILHSIVPAHVSAHTICYYIADHLCIRLVTIYALLWSKTVESHSVRLYFSSHSPLSSANFLMLPDVIDNSFRRHNADILERPFNNSWLVSHVEQDHRKVPICQWSCPHLLVSILAFGHHVTLHTCKPCKQLMIGSHMHSMIL